MTFRSDLYEYLDADSGLEAIVGARIYPHQAPTDAQLPYITFAQVANPSTHHFGAAAAIASPTIQFDCWATTDVQLESITEALRDALDGIRHTNVGSGPTQFLSVMIEGQIDDIEQPTDGSEDSVYRSSVDVIIWYQRSVPTF